MLNAILKNGVIEPIDPLPTEWQEGTRLEVCKATGMEIDIDAWVERMNALCADSEAAEEELMRGAIEEHRRLAKEQARRAMGLSA